MRRNRFLGWVAFASLVAAAGCGGGERQDADEPEGDFAVEVVSAKFPERQRLGQSSELVITVRNAGDKRIPNAAVTLQGLGYRATAPELSDAERPQFALDGVQRDIGKFPEAKEAAPVGCDTAYINTWACGPLAPGAERTFVWRMSAVRSGPYDIRWSVAAGLNGKAKAVSAGGGAAPSGRFRGAVSRAIPDVSIADDGKTVVTETP